MWLLKPKVDGSGFDEEEVRREGGGRKYKIVTREYLVQGHDGYEDLTGGERITNHECGSSSSSVVKSYLLGKQFINKLLQSRDEREIKVSSQTREFIDALKAASGSSCLDQRWKQAVRQVLETQSRTHYRKDIHISVTDNMNTVDVFDELESRLVTADDLDDDLVISPQIDGRLKDIAPRDI